MRIWALIFFCGLLLPGCKNKNAVPGNILPQKEMQAIIWDLMRADQFLNDYIVSRNPSLNKTNESFKYYQQIFALHKISKEDFQHSFTYYQAHPLLLKQVMDSIATMPAVAVSPSLVTKPDSVKKTEPIRPDTVIANPMSNKKSFHDSILNLRNKRKPGLRDK